MGTALAACLLLPWCRHHTTVNNDLQQITDGLQTMNCVQGDGSAITVEPGLIGGEVNRILANYARVNKLPIQYKIGPDPSSIDSCMIGGIVNNNSSGM
jgi:FAD/FMN-containing dehydrogenase